MKPANHERAAASAPLPSFVSDTEFNEGTLLRIVTVYGPTAGAKFVCQVEKVDPLDVIADLAKDGKLRIVGSPFDVDGPVKP